jgi:hypothetical protein
MNDISKTLERLANTFTVRDIMVKAEELVYADGLATALQIIEENVDFDVIPIKKDGILKAYLERGKNKEKYIDLRELISDATSVLEAVTILQERKFCFVLSGQRITGYVHFSDLNNHVVKLPFYVLFESVERQLAAKIKGSISKTEIQSLLDRKRSSDVIDKMKSLRENRADLDWVNLLYFGEILKFAGFYGFLNLDQIDIDIVASIRNRVDHADEQLVKKFDDVKTLSRAHQICASILMTQR